MTDLTDEDLDYFRRAERDAQRRTPCGHSLMEACFAPNCPTAAVGTDGPLVPVLLPETRVRELHLKWGRGRQNFAAKAWYLHGEALEDFNALLAHIGALDEKIVALNQANAAALARLETMRTEHARLMQESQREFQRELRDAVAEARAEGRDHGGF